MKKVKANKLKNITIEQLWSILRVIDTHKEDQYYECRCHILDMYRTLNYYVPNLTIGCDRCLSYSSFNVIYDHNDMKKDILYQSPTSMYGDIKFGFIHDNIIIQFICSPRRELYSNNFLKTPYLYSPKNVYLDIETTGLDVLSDEITSIALYQPSTGKSVHKMIKLEKHNQYYLNELQGEKYFGVKKPKIVDVDTYREIMHQEGISDELMDNASIITQDMINDCIKYFDLHHNTLSVWTGKNLFDILFLEKYFNDHELDCGFQIKFNNASDCLMGNENFMSKSKDAVALRLKIDTSGSHNALKDCVIENEICQKIFNNEIPEHINVEELTTLLATTYAKITKLEATTIYNQLCDYCIMRYGFVDRDYDDHPRTRGKEYIDIHHIDETTLDDIGKRTHLAQMEEDNETLKELKPFNKRNRLVYAPHPIHFLLHCLIHKIRGEGGGPHWLWHTMLKNNEWMFSLHSLEYAAIYQNICGGTDEVENFWEFGSTPETRKQTIEIFKQLKRKRV